MYADDSQLYIVINPRSDRSAFLSKIELCVSDVFTCFTNTPTALRATLERPKLFASDHAVRELVSPSKRSQLVTLSFQQCQLSKTSEHYWINICYWKSRSTTYTRAPGTCHTKNREDRPLFVSRSLWEAGTRVHFLKAWLAQFNTLWPTSYRT